MEFQLFEEELQLRNTVREFTEEKIEPVANDLDRTRSYPVDLISELADMGIVGMTLPETYGGLDNGLLDYAIAIKELTVGLMAVPSPINVYVITATFLEKFGHDDLKEKKSGSPGKPSG